MLKYFKYRLYPTDKQAELINKHIGACRFVYNLALETKKTAYAGSKVNLTAFDLMKQLPDLKKECEWLKEVSAPSLQQSISNLDKAYTSFFKGQNGFPKFKKKSTRGGFTVPQHVSVKDGVLIIPKFREGIKVTLHRQINGHIRQATILRTPTGKYFVSILCETGAESPIKPKPTEGLGIDLGLKDLIITSDGIKVKNPKYLKNSLERLKVLQRRADRKKRGSNNQKKANRRVVIVHERVANQRRDFLHKLSSKLVSENQTLCFEDLNVAGMVKNHSLARTISDTGWGMFVEMCKYKADWNGRNILFIPRFEPSTKICNCCGHTNNNLTLNDRSWTCVCGAEHDRDINAAKNIRNYCIRNSGEAIPGGPVELPTLVGAVKQEVFNLKKDKQ